MKIDMDTTEFVLALIKGKYKSVRQFALAADIPYSTIKSGLKAGINGMAVETVIKMCATLGIQLESLMPNHTDFGDPRQLSSEEWRIITKFRNLSDNSKLELVRYLDFREQLDEHNESIRYPADEQSKTR
ncbi:hypothetical protein DRA42_11900 [Ethanoligenens harbinense]|nr:hypothetical protein CXQ68_11865 [Ethanoligenens harbinense YUAN-3]AYF39505.1 hypothetical protein CXP51_11760 [Ethanoligenens harbinense]AYF42330.1 hypothetical protein CN246_12310 [Ethanoligenens harbinense]QCN93084.1 hypothetical protein DRA42_11900 [Ethanoligenens harbinense]